jgi:ATP-dependent DNA ligase
MGLEGLVSKHRDRPYRGGRQKHWIKIRTGSITPLIASSAERSVLHNFLAANHKSQKLTVSSAVGGFRSRMDRGIQ